MIWKWSFYTDICLFLVYLMILSTAEIMYGWSEIMISEGCEVTSRFLILTFACWKLERWCKTSVSTAGHEPYIDKRKYKIKRITRIHLPLQCSFTQMLFARTRKAYIKRHTHSHCTGSFREWTRSQSQKMWFCIVVHYWTLSMKCRYSAFFIMWN